MKTVLKSEKYGTIVGEDVQSYCTNVSILEKPQYRKISIMKSIEDVTEEDLLNACEKLVNRPIVTDEDIRRRLS